MICFTNRTSLTLQNSQVYLQVLLICKSFEIHLQLYLNKIMGFRLPRIVQAKKLLRQSSFNASQSSTTATVPKGHLAVYVGESQRKRFLIPVSFLNHTSFQDLLSQAEEEFGFDHPMGGLTIPCTEYIFVDLISRLSMP
ncbi:hypothetical protein ACOSQ3_005860 [Xanthoceras sorbifolium]